MRALADLLAVWTEPPPDEVGYHRWYDEEHVPPRLALDGFVGGGRWAPADGGRRFLATYDLASVEVLASPAYRALGAQRSRREVAVLASLPHLVRTAQVAVASWAAPRARPASDLVVLAWGDGDGDDRGVGVPGVGAAGAVLAAGGAVRARAYRRHEGGPAVLVLVDLAVGPSPLADLGGDGWGELLATARPPEVARYRPWVGLGPGPAT